MNTQSRKVAVITDNRIPFGHHNTYYTHASNQELMVAKRHGLIDHDRHHLQGRSCAEIAGRTIIKHSREFNLMHSCAMDTSLGQVTPACDIQQASDAGIEAAIYIRNRIGSRQLEVAGRVDSTSNVLSELMK